MGKKLQKLLQRETSQHTTKLQHRNHIMHDRPKQSSRSIRKDTNLGIGSTGPLQETNPQKELCRTHLPRDKGTHVPERQGKTTGSVKHQPSRDELLQEVEEPNPEEFKRGQEKLGRQYDQ